MARTLKPVVVRRTRVWKYAGVDKAAAELGVSRNTMYQYLSGRIPKALNAEKRSRVKVVTVKEEECI